MANDRLLEYYARRALEYEEIYEKPERRQDLARVRAWLRQELAGHRVLEIACGTGYWTAWIAPVVSAIVAIDAGAEVLEVAQAKSYPLERVRFARADAHALAAIAGDFTAAFAGFWWSHVPHERQQGFLATLHARIGPGARVVLLDNRYVPGSSTPIVRSDSAGNSYQRRRLGDGSEHEVLKNFPTAAELDAVLSPVSDDLEIVEFEYYWGARYAVKQVA